MTTGAPLPPNGCKTIHYLLVAATFAAAYGQAALYYSNQNQYFLHGFALADVGLLPEDWLAGTLDPTPLFSQLTARTMTYLDPWVFHLYHALLVGIYAAAMLDLFVVLSRRASRWPVFALLFVFIHSAALRWMSYHWIWPQAFRLDYPWYFQAGVASHYLLGGMFQPSVFGVLLLAGLSLFLRDRLVLSSLCIAGAATMHNTYLLPGAMLTAGFLTQLGLERRYRAGLMVGLPTLALVLPTVIHSLQTFAPTSAEQFARAQDILANDRIPHHCRVDRWLDVVAVLQIVWVLIGLMLVWQTRLFAVLAVCVALSSLLTVAQVMTQSDLLALLFPWRISAVLVPVATTIVLSRLVGAWPDSSRATDRWPLAAFLGLLALAAAGIGISVGRQAFQSPVDDLPLMNFVREHKKPGDVYLLPVKVPSRQKVSADRIRSISSDFKPPVDKQKDARLIPLDLQQFRLHAEAPILVDFKSIPYKDVEVIEWYDRLLFADEVQELLKKGEVRKALRRLRERGVTHVVQPAEQKELIDPGLRLIYPTAGNEDPRYRLYELVK
jgi:hypothetical protein